MAGTAKFASNFNVKVSQTGPAAETLTIGAGQIFAANAGAVIDGIIVQTVVGAAATTCTIYKNSAIAGNRMIDPVNTAAGSGPVFAAFDAANPSANNIGSSDSILIVTSGAVQVTVLFLCSSSGFNKNVTVT